jgi:hypothetical protein
MRLQLVHGRATNGKNSPPAKFRRALTKNWSTGEKRMSVKSIATVAGTAAVLSACSFLQPAHNVTQANPPYDPATQARVRILAGNGTGVANLWKNSSCYTYSLPDPGNRVRVNDGFWAAWKYSSTSVTIGMSPSPRKGMRPDGLDFKDFIKEYVVDA